MARPLLTTCLASLGLAVFASTAASVPTATFDENVFRLRVPPGESFSVSMEGGGRDPGDPGQVARYFVAGVSGPVDFGPGCRLQPNMSFPDLLQLWCALDPPSVDVARVRYRVSFADGNDEVYSTLPELPGVVYAGEGKDEVYFGDRVFGGPSEDFLEGKLVYGGAGDDRLIGKRFGPTNVLQGGAGDDSINREGVVGGPNWAYGGRGDDMLGASLYRDMLVGGPGRDVVVLVLDEKPDVVRVRGGGDDLLRCFGSTLSERTRFVGEGHDIVFADSGDRVDRRCKGTRVRLEGRPRLRG